MGEHPGLTEKTVRAWAEVKPEGAVVGKANDALECPFSNFLKDLLFSSHIAVGFSLFEDRCPALPIYRVYDLPMFAQKTIRMIDAATNFGGYVTRERFLRFLDMAKAEPWTE